MVTSTDLADLTGLIWGPISTKSCVDATLLGYSIALANLRTLKTISNSRQSPHDSNAGSANGALFRNLIMELYHQACVEKSMSPDWN